MKTKCSVRELYVEITGEVLESVFDECDRYDRDETGGRVVGHFSLDEEALIVRAKGVIEPGPNARRTSTSFFQDGDYQTEIFRHLEANDPLIEHLGNWHTHHVNGYPTLSSGDVATYRRIVNHNLHNLDFFYALLVTKRYPKRTELKRYSVRHYVLFRGDDGVYEIPPENVRVTDDQRIWPQIRSDIQNVDGSRVADGDKSRGVFEVRANDKHTLEMLCPSMEPRLSSKTGTFFWKGKLPLIDGSVIDIKVAEVKDDGELFYIPVVSSASQSVSALCETPHPSASHVVRALESLMNQEIYESVKKRRGFRIWKY